jgi:hypothetical protein
LIGALGGGYYVATTYFGENAEQKVVLPSLLEPREKIEYVYKIHLHSGGTLESAEIVQQDQQVMVKNEAGLEMTLNLPAIAFIEKIQKDDGSKRELIYGENPGAK